MGSINYMWNTFKPKKGRKEDPSKIRELSADALTKSADGSRCCWQWYSNREFGLGWSLALVAGILVWAVAARAQVQPLGNPPPPAGTQWVPVLDDEFVNDSGINTNLWNGGDGGGVPWCVNGIDAFNHDAPPGGSCAEYFGTPGTAPYASILPGTGLLVQNFNNYQDPVFPGGSWMGIQSYGKFVQRYGYWEVAFKEPTDNNGEGDGLHTDVWVTPPCRTDFTGNTSIGCQDEVDLAEDVLGTTNHGTVSNAIFDANNLAGGQEFSTGNDVTSTFNVTGMSWVPDSNQGTVHLYMNGSQVTGPVSLSDSGWSQGVWMLPGWVQQAGSSSFDGGNSTDSSTSNNDPLIIKYVRVWQAQTISGTPTPPPPPTPTPAPPPTSTCSVSIASPVNGSTVSSQFTVTLTQSGCGMNFNRLQVSAPGFSGHYDFTGTSNTLNLPANTYSISDSAWSDNTYLGKIGASGTIFATITASRQQAGGQVP
jgi:hypothetical protein